MATSLKPIECSAQPLSISFHPVKNILAAGLVDGTIEIHDLIAKGGEAVAAAAVQAKSNDDDDDDKMESDQDGDNGPDTIIASIYVAKEVAPSKTNTYALAKVYEGSTTTAAAPPKKAAQGPSCRCVLFSQSPDAQSGGEHIYTACNNGSLRCLDSDLACKLDPNAPSPIIWSIENAHTVGISKVYQLPQSSPVGPALVTGDDIGNIRLWDTKVCAQQYTTSNQNDDANPFDNLMKLPTGCIQHWKINHDYITDFEINSDGTTLFASSADGTLSVLDLKYIHRKNTSRSVILPDIDPNKTPTLPSQQKNKNKRSTWDTHGYTKSDNQEDELLSLVLLKKSTKLLCGTQEGILALFSYGHWGDISDRFPGHPQSIDALLKIDEDTVLTGSSDGLVRAVQLLPNALLGVLGGHDGFPVEGLGWSAGRKMVGSMSHDEYIRLWDASLLNDDDSDEEGEVEVDMQEGGVSSKQGLAGVSTKATAGEDSEDDWEDMDEDKDEEMDSDDSDSDDSENNGGKGPKKRENIFKTENEEFFSDL